MPWIDYVRSLYRHPNLGLTENPSCNGLACRDAFSDAGKLQPSLASFTEHIVDPIRSVTLHFDGELIRGVLVGNKQGFAGGHY